MSLRLLNNSYYKRFRWRDTYGNQKERAINLMTNNLEIAKIRGDMILPLKPEIIFGKDFKFPWENENQEGIISYKNHKIQDIINEYLSFRKKDQVSPLRESTMMLYIGQFKRIKEYLYNRNIRSITEKDMNQFITKEIERKISFNTINITIRTINKFLKWCISQKYIRKPIIISKLKIPIQPPQYISEADFSKIMKNLRTSELKEFYEMYLRTGMRLSEPYNGRVEGNFMILPSQFSKTGREREIPIKDVDIRIIKKLKNSKISSKRLSFLFKEAAKKANVDTKFHAIRHSFAIRKYLESNDIYLVKELLGHSAIATSEIYTNFNLRKLIQDFPNIERKIMG